MKVGDVVKNPIKVEAEDFLSDITEITSSESTVTAIFVKDESTEEKGYTKRVNESIDPDAIVVLDGDIIFKKFKLSVLDA